MGLANWPMGRDVPVELLVRVCVFPPWHHLSQHNLAIISTQIFYFSKDDQVLYMENCLKELNSIQARSRTDAMPIGDVCNFVEMKCTFLLKFPKGLLGPNDSQKN